MLRELGREWLLNMTIQEPSIIPCEFFYSYQMVLNGRLWRHKGRRLLTGSQNPASYGPFHPYYHSLWNSWHEKDYISLPCFLLHTLNACKSLVKCPYKETEYDCVCDDLFKYLPGIELGWLVQCEEGGDHHHYVNHVNVPVSSSNITTDSEMLLCIQTPHFTGLMDVYLNQGTSDPTVWKGEDFFVWATLSLACL